MRRYLSPLFTLLFITAVPLGYAGYRSYHFRNFQVVTPDVLYRSGQLSPYGLQRVWYENGLGTVVSLRPDDSLRMPYGRAWDEESTRKKLPPRETWEPEPWHVRGKGDHWEETYCKAQGIRFIRLEPLPWHAKKGAPIPAQVNVDRFVEVLRDPVKYPRPILLHCFRGAHRTGVFIAIYRMEMEHWSNEAAIAELPTQGYDVEDHDDVCRYLRSYVPAWKKEQKVGVGTSPKSEPAITEMPLPLMWGERDEWPHGTCWALPLQTRMTSSSQAKTIDPDVVNTGWSPHTSDVNGTPHEADFTAGILRFAPAGFWAIARRVAIPNERMIVDEDRFVPGSWYPRQTLDEPTERERLAKHSSYDFRSYPWKQSILTTVDDVVARLRSRATIENQQPIERKPTTIAVQCPSWLPGDDPAEPTHLEAFLATYSLPVTLRFFRGEQYLSSYTLLRPVNLDKFGLGDLILELSSCGYASAYTLRDPRELLVERYLEKHRSPPIEEVLWAWRCASPPAREPRLPFSFYASFAR